MARGSTPFRITSAIPGRVRLQLADSNGRLQGIAERIARIPSVFHVASSSETRSVVVRFDARARDLDDVVLDIRAAAAEGSRRGRGTIPVESTVNATPNAADGTDLLHAIPGRVRLRLSALRGRRDLAPRLEHYVAAQPGIHSAEVQPDTGFVIIRYNPQEWTLRRVISLVERELRVVLTQRLPEDEFHRAGDIRPESPNQLNPLVLPTVAFAIAAMESAPALLVGAALTAAALPIAQRALKGARRGCIATEQLDIATMLLLVSQGNYIAAGTMAWLIALANMIRGNARTHVRQAVLDLESVSGPHTAAAVAQAPVTGTRYQIEAAQMSNRFAKPIWGLALTDYLLTRNPSRVVGIVKPRCELEAGLQFGPPAAVLTTITTAARNGVLFAGGHTMERLAEVDALIVDLGRDRLGADLEGQLVQRGVKRIVRSVRGRNGARHALGEDDLHAQGHRVAVLTDQALGPVPKEDRPLCVFLARPGTAIPEEMDVVLAGGDVERLLYAIDVARAGTSSERRSVRILGAAGVVNLAATMLNLSPAPLSTFINTGASVTVAINALRPPAPPQPSAASPPERRTQGRGRRIAR